MESNKKWVWPENDTNILRHCGEEIIKIYHECDGGIKWASSRENLSLGCQTKRVLNQSVQLLRLASN